MAGAAAGDPLDEPAYAPPDLAVVHHGYAGLKVRMNRMADGLYLSNIYWTLGPGPAGGAPSCVDDPPTSGWARCLVFPGQAGDPRRVLCMWTFRSYDVRPGSHEWRSMHGNLFLETDAEKAEWLKGHLRRRWIELQRATERSGEPDFALAARALEALGSAPPSDSEVAAAPRPRAASRPAPAKPEPRTPVASTFKPVKRAGRKGEVLAFFIEKGLTASRSEAMAKFGITSSNLLSQLFLLRKDHGIDYKAEGDTVRLTLPAGTSDPFQEAL